MGASEVNSDETADPDEEGDKRKKRKKKKGLVQKVVKSLNCCSAQRRSSSKHKNGVCTRDPPYEPGARMGPLTLSEFVETLEPYDPSIHGWRGQEPRPHWTGLATPKIHPRSGLQPNRAALL